MSEICKENEEQKAFIMRPIVAYCFKELMNVEKVRNGFISAVLGIRPKTIQNSRLLPTILRKTYPEEKYGILDVRVLLNDQTQIDMEIQVLYFAYWKERTVFYLGKMYTDQIEEGQSYQELKKCVNISILDFVLFPDNDEFYSCYQLREKVTGQLYTDKLEIHVLELPKLNGIQYPENTLMNWAKFLYGESRKEFEAMADKDEYISEAYKTLDKISADKMKRLEYEAREKAIRDYNHQMYHARKVGLDEGLRLGRNNGIQVLIQSCKNLGLDYDHTKLQVKEGYHLSEDELADVMKKYW